jgi:hypothetical protein
MTICAKRLMLRHELGWVLLLLVCTAMGCSLLAPTDEELFGKGGSAGASGAGSVAAASTGGAITR